MRNEILLIAVLLTTSSARAADQAVERQRRDFSGFKDSVRA